MGKFIMILKNKAVGALKEELLIMHVEHLRKLEESGKLFLCGPFKDNGSAIQILVAENLGEAELLAKNDPFIEHKYYRSHELHELIEANEENNYLLSDNQTKVNLK